MAYSGSVTRQETGWKERLGDYRNVLAVTIALTMLQGASAALSVMIALSLADAGVSNAGLGLVAAFFAGGFLMGALLSPAQISRIGHIRSFAFFAAIAIIAALSFTLGVSLIGWALVQGVIGICTSALFTAGESWIADAAPADSRGSILSFYHVVSKLGAVGGPFLIMAGAGGAGGFLIVAVLFALTILPITATRQSQPELSTGKPFGPRRIFRLAPAAAIAAFCAGAVNNSVAQLYPVYAQVVAPDQVASFAANFNAAILGGAIVGLWPAGMISDRIDRRLVIAATGLIGAVCALGLGLVAGVAPQVLIFVLGFGYGVGALSFYAIAVAHAADRAEANQATPMMAGIIVLWGIGSIVGPPVAGLIMTPFGGAGLFFYASGALALLAALMFTRTVNADPVGESDKEPFNATQATSLALSDLDPRGEEENEQFDLFLAWMASQETDE